MISRKISCHFDFSKGILSFAKSILSFRESERHHFGKGVIPLRFSSMADSFHMRFKSSPCSVQREFPLTTPSGLTIGMSLNTYLWTDRIRVSECILSVLHASVMGLRLGARGGGGSK
jgi:hypothetical protein